MCSISFPKSNSLTFQLAKCILHVVLDDLSPLLISYYKGAIWPKFLSKNSQPICSGCSKHCYSRCLVAFVHVSLQNEDIQFMMCNKWMMFHEKRILSLYILHCCLLHPLQCMRLMQKRNGTLCKYSEEKSSQKH